MVESKKKFRKIYAVDKVCKKFHLLRGRIIRRAPSRSRRPPRLPLASAAVSLVRLTVTEDSKASSTATTPKESSRKIQFNRQGNTPPGHYSGASWETYERKKRPREDDGDDDGDDGAIGA